jgi:hypothetical protein
VTWLDFAWRSLRVTDGIGSSSEVNWLIDGVCGPTLPTIDLAHVDLAGSSAQNNMAAVSADGGTRDGLLSRWIAPADGADTLDPTKADKRTRSKPISRRICAH